MSSSERKTFIALKYELLSDDWHKSRIVIKNFPVDVVQNWMWKVCDLELSKLSKPMIASVQHSIRISRLYKEHKVGEQELNQAWINTLGSESLIESYFYYATVSDIDSFIDLLGIEEHYDDWKYINQLNKLLLEELYLNEGIE